MKKNPFHSFFSLSVILIVGAILGLLNFVLLPSPTPPERLFLNAISFSLSILAIWIVVYHGSRNDDLFDEPRYADKDEDLSELYKNKFGGMEFNGKPLGTVDVYIFYFTGFVNKSPVALYRSRTPKILIKSDFLEYVDADELDALILHELGHYMSKWGRTSKKYTLLFLLAFVTILFSGISILLYGQFVSILTVTIIGFSILLVVLYFSFAAILGREEVNCDLFSVKFLKKDSISSALNKMLEYAGKELSKRRFSTTANRMEKRLAKLRVYNEQR